LNEGGRVSYAVRLRRALFSAAAATLVVSGCAPSEYIADYSIRPLPQAVMNGRTAPGTWSSFQFDGVKPIPSGRYTDERMLVEWTLVSSEISLKIENRSSGPLQVLWSESRIEGDFQAPLILGQVGPAEERKLPQQPTTIVSGATATMRAFAGPPGRWQPLTDDPTKGFWQRQRPLFDIDVDKLSGDERESAVRATVGRSIRLVIVFRSAGERQELVLPAEVTEARVRAVYY
jgi:hypothetical protein